MIKITQNLVSLVIFPALLMQLFFSTAFAAGESTQVQIKVEHLNYVRLTGTAVGSSRMFSIADVKPVGNNRRGPKVVIGTLGLESNQSGNCTMTFSTDNTFKLRHIVSNKRLTRYRLFYLNKRITKNKNTRTLPCNSTNEPLYFQSVGRFRNNIEAGVYRDTVHLVVTTQ